MQNIISSDCMKMKKNIIVLSGDFVHIKLLGGAAEKTSALSGIFAKVSHSALSHIENEVWYLGKDGYAFAYMKIENQIIRIKLHQLVYALINGKWCPKGYCVDHVNRDRLDNTNDNLRLATPQENSFNRTKNKNSQGKFKGVKKIAENNYLVSLTRDGVKYKVSGFASEEEAAQTYDVIALEIFGEFAALNFPK
jgi:hypothetical protein